jgi:dipeptide/tripeptide permease
VAEPHGRSSYAPVEAIGQPYHDKSPEGHDIESVPTEERIDDPDYPLPTEEEKSTLRRVADHIPAVSFALCTVEFAERASYYGVVNIFSNFMQFPLPAGGNGAGAPPKGTQQTAGALGKGLQFSNAFVLLFTFLAYVIPIFGAWLADTRLGRYKTITLGVFICGVAHVVLIIGAIPSVLQGGNAIAPYLIAFFILAFGAGMCFSNMPVQALLSDFSRCFQTKYCPNSA